MVPALHGTESVKILFLSVHSWQKPNGFIAAQYPAEEVAAKETQIISGIGMPAC